VRWSRSHDPEQALRVLASVGLAAARIMDAALAVRAHSIVPELPVSIA
jgi:hypothetical protein